MVSQKPNSAVVTFGSLDANAEVIGGENYIGELPPAGKALPGIIRRVFLTESSMGDPILKVLYEVTDGPYAGFTAWDNVTLNNKAAFKWQPFLRVLGVTPQELIRHTRVNADDVTDVGRRVLAIGERDLSDDENPVGCHFGVQYRTFDGVRTPHVIGSKPRTVSGNETAGNKAVDTDKDDESFIHE